MTTIPTAPDDMDELVRQTVASIRYAVELRDQSYIRIGQRVTRIIRISMISSGVVGVAILLIVAVLTWQFREMVTAMAKINGHFNHMSRNMATLHTVIERMDQHVSSMQKMAATIKGLDGTVAILTQDIGTIQNNMGRVRHNLTQVQSDVVRMANIFDALDLTVLGIGHDVNTISQPLQNYNQMRSFAPMMPFP